ncbi:hypothetical protein BDZ89DRAFT_1065066 [Hymenopellis radicata]|nr:hypothetical protein BDZ89DRAFT_1065066 [Hymenopellis radicata]
MSYTVGTVLPLHYCFPLKPHNVLREVVHTRTRRSALVVLFTISLVFGILIVLDYPLYPFSSSVEIELSHPNSEPTIVQDISDGVSWVQFTDIQDGIIYHPFSPNPPEYSIADHRVRPIRSHTQLSGACLEQWVGTGRWEGPCAAQKVEDAVIDLVYVWVNGSDPLHEKARTKYIESTGHHPKNARFREHDELRYSLRASAKATESWKESVWHVITADVPHPRDSSRRLGLVPQWLDLNASGIMTESQQPPIHLYHDSQLFRLINSTDAPLTVEAAEAWRENVLPTFNSVSLNDDQFLALPTSPSAFHSTLYGPVFRFERNIQVGGDATGKADGGGEWRSLGWSAHLLNVRFGSRTRAYVAHNARSFSLPLMHEASLAFGQQFSATPLSRFRGSHKGPNEIEVNTVFLTTHWVIERKREAMLWSWIVAKWGATNGGVLDEETKMAMWKEAGGQEDSNEIPLENIRKTTPDDVDVQLTLAGLQSPRVPDRTVAAHTDYTFVAQDGYPTALNGLKLSGALYKAHCFGSGETSAWDLFLDVLTHKSGCGDAIIAALIQQGGVFLPPGSTEVDPSDPIVLPLQLPSEAPPLPASPRAFAIRLFHRYAFAVGETPSRFFGLTSYRQGTRTLQQTTDQKDIALLCINDDLPENSPQLQRTDELLKDWFQNRWPEKLDREIQL